MEVSVKKCAKVFAILALALPGAAACSHNAQPVRVTMQSLPPLSGKIKIETTIVPRSQKFKVAVLTFIDQTGRAQLVVDPIADMLTTELFMVKRFELYDRQDLVEQTHAKSFGQNQEAKVTGGGSEKTSNQKQVSQGKVDGILLGYITSYKANDAPEDAPQADPKKKGAKEDPKGASTRPRESDGSGEFSLDFRIVNTALSADTASNRTDKKIDGLKELVVFGDSAKVKFRVKGGNIELDRNDVAKIAAGIKEKFPEFTERKINITSLQEGMVSLNVGEQNGVKQGFTGYVVKHDDRSGVNRYLAEFVIINVFKDAATAVVVPDSNSNDESNLSNILANISVGSEAVIK
jgi:curli biogenesis system outer membrane secretion channel CsgG